MEAKLGTRQRPLRVAVIGAGPSGFYAAGQLLKQPGLEVAIDLFDQLPTPFGLVRYGVAPDHPKIKSVTRTYDKIAADPRVRYFGNVRFGKDITHEEIRQFYDQVVYAVGSQTDRRLNIPGEDLVGSYSSTDFVNWYNGHPNAANRDFDLSCEKVAVIGVGNVALDVARILARSVDELQETDIADYALRRLAESRVKDIYIIARRGPGQTKFTNPELLEFDELELADTIVDPQELLLDPISASSLKDNRVAENNLDILHDYSLVGDTGKPRKIHFLFLRSPREIHGRDGRVVGITLEKNELRRTESGYLQAFGTGEVETLPVGIVMRAIGYLGQPLPGVPFDESRGIIPNEGGRVIDPDTKQRVIGEYVVGWAKRGPTGVIGTNKPDSAATVRSMLADLNKIAPVLQENAHPEAVESYLVRKGVRYVSWSDWQLIDETERARGRRAGRPRIKITQVPEMLRAVDDAREAKTLDILVIGAGPVGLYAAFCAGLRHLKARILEGLPTVGGQLTTRYPELMIYDVPGHPKIIAQDLVDQLLRQVSPFNIELCVNSKAEQLRRLANGVYEVTDSNRRVHRTRRVIIAAGIGAVTPVKLPNPSVAAFEGNGVYYVVKDKDRFLDKNVLVVGGGDSAVLWALKLKDWAKRVTLIHRRDRFRAKEANVTDLRNRAIDVRLFYELKEVQGRHLVERAVIQDVQNGMEETLEVDAVLLCLGFLAETGNLRRDWGLEMVGGCCQVNGFMQTNLPGVYAVGDVAQPIDGPNLRLISQGCGQAAVAVNHACHSLRPEQDLVPRHSSEMRL